MRIGINTVGIGPGWGGAEETFLRHVLRELSHFDASASVLVFTDGDNHASYDGYERVCIENGSRLDRAAGDVDVVLASIDRLPSKAPCAVLPYATNVRGLARAAESRGLFSGSPLKTLKARLAAAPVIVAASKFVEQQLLKLAEVPLNKLIVAPLGVDPVFSEPSESILERPYLLTVGNTNSWKRIDLLMEAFDRLKEETPFNLAIVGRPGDAELGDWGDRVFRIDRLPQKHLAGLYQNCEAFVRAGSDDGTGLTILEAMTAGAIVAAPRAGAVAEMGGNAPVYFNRDNLDSLVGVLRRVCQMPEDERARRATLGRQIAQEFTWERCAKQVLKALRRAVERR